MYRYRPPGGAVVALRAPMLSLRQNVTAASTATALFLVLATSGCAAPDLLDSDSEEAAASSGDADDEIVAIPEPQEDGSDDEVGTDAAPLKLTVQRELVPASPSKAKIARFRIRDQAFRGGRGYYDDIPRYAASRSLGHNLGWGAQHVWESYLAAYRTSGDTYWLDRMVREVDRALAYRDDKLGRKDYKGRARPAWGTARYSANGEYATWATHNGYAVYQMLRFVKLVRETPSLQPKYGQKSKSWLLSSKRIAWQFDDDWRSGPLPGAGHYIYPQDLPMKTAGDRGKPQRLNHMNGLGAAIVLLAGLTGEAHYVAKAKAMARYFKATIKKVPNGSYLWTYYPFRDEKTQNVTLFVPNAPESWTTAEGQSLHAESIQYAGLNAQFAWEAYRHGLVFDKNDMRAMARTLVDNMWKPTAGGSARISHRMNGKEISTRDEDLMMVAMRWLVLAEVDPRVYDVALASYDAATKSANTLIAHTAAANLDLYKAVLEK